MKRSIRFKSFSMFDEVEDCLDMLEVLIDIEISPEMPPGTAEEILFYAANTQPDLFGM